MLVCTRRSCLTTVLGAAYCIVEGHARAQNNKKTADPFIGTWALDPTQSSFVPGPVPAGRTMVFEAVDNGFRNMIMTEGIGANNSYTVKFDGKDYAGDGASNIDTYSVKRVDANTIERRGKQGGKVVEIATFRISPDGKILNLTVKGSFQGTDYSSTQVYIKL
jgi:hypothetical protein